MFKRLTSHRCYLCLQVGRLWTSLADYYIRQGMYESARDVYEEGLTTVTTVRDFSLIFDTLTQFEETLLAHKMENGGDVDEPEQANGVDDDGEDFLLKDDEDDIDLRWAGWCLCCVVHCC